MLPKKVSSCDSEKYDLVVNRVPPPSFLFPPTIYKDKTKKIGERKRSCQHIWFQRFKFVTYSEEEDGLFCLPCVLFPVEPTFGGSRATYLIKSPYRNWKDATCDLDNHKVLEYHKSSEDRLKAFEENIRNSLKRSIDLMLDERAVKQIQENRQIMSSIIRGIEFCGRQGISLRGHRDDDSIFDNAFRLSSG